MHENLRIIDSGGAISVHSKGPDMDPGLTVVEIPKASVLSVRALGLRELSVLRTFGREAQFALALALCIETTKGSESRWHGYLQSLPKNQVDLPVFWSNDLDAMRFLNGTEIQKRLVARDSDDLNLFDSLLSFYENTAVAVSEKYSGSKVPFESFTHAYSLVSSRAFLVDAYHGLSMVPIADAFNHSQDNHVHFESEYDVCPECGAVDRCAHDSPPPSPTHELAPSIDPVFEMVSNTVIPSGEVFNTYGEDLSNADLLMRYGFMSDVNDNDRVVWELVDDTIPQDRDVSALEDAELVSKARDGFYINSDGLLSYNLFFHVAGPISQAEIDGVFESPNLSNIATSIIDLCTERKALLMNIDDLDVDELSPRMRWIVLEIMSEASILESCISRWSEVQR
ncbi:SET domain-containing protein [Cylindrobasidium torrendii FP15055 ss-10]|uniref:SET domain-containing protein n=1 Tax=Cylindrobasidium torrendii FP15055 ss-10 TaxID=1314674 RepID=A0A0D7BDE4_9AGAR|nr:SET domain-containing protein [Cylindrobasidium torrendii FP15055 ss-10]